jgi:peptide-methionine (R)-S-oxide reductase
MKTIGMVGLVLMVVAAVACGRSPGSARGDAERDASMAPSSDAVKASTVSDTGKVVKSDAEWKKILTPEQYNILREKGTESPFTGKYYDNHEKGIYSCAACGNQLFSSETKFESGTGWPSFWQPIASGHVDEEHDGSFGVDRTEVLCARCGGHLGHVFDDGPPPTHLRYCINSAALTFEKE